MAHEIHGELSVLSSIGTDERLHNVFVVTHHLPLSRRHVRLVLLAIEQLRLRGAIPKMLNPPPFMRRTVNSARGGRLNTMLA